KTFILRKRRTGAIETIFERGDIGKAGVQTVYDPMRDAFTKITLKLQAATNSVFGILRSARTQGKGSTRAFFQAELFILRILLVDTCIESLKPGVPAVLIGIIQFI